MGQVLMYECNMCGQLDEGGEHQAPMTEHNLKVPVRWRVLPGLEEQTVVCSSCAAACERAGEVALEMGITDLKDSAKPEVRSNRLLMAEFLSFGMRQAAGRPDDGQKTDDKD